MSQTLLVTSMKGGSGKSLLAVHLLVAARASGMTSLLCDADLDQGTALAWQRVRGSTDDVRRTQPDELAKVIKQNKRDLLIVDSAPRADSDVVNMARMASFILIPVRPALPDIMAADRAVAIAKAARRPFATVINGAYPRTPETAEARDVLSELGAIVPVDIYNRIAFARALGAGEAVTEFAPKSEAAREISQLWSYLRKCL
jgi:chromosome partitioning protein